MILLADRMAGEVLLDLEGELGELLRADVLSLQLVKCGQEGDEIRARRSEPGARRHVGHRRDLDVPVDAEELQGGSHEIVADFRGRLDLLVGRST